jgi:aspartate/methionine/tyrosine aminotransferase
VRVSQRTRGPRSTRGTDCTRKHALWRSLYGGGVHADDVVCCVPQEGVLLAHALLAPGDHVVVTAPGYQSLHSLASTLRCEVSPWLPARSDAGVLHFDVEDLKRLVRPGAQATTPVCCGVVLSCWRLTPRLQARRRSSS